MLGGEMVVAMHAVDDIDPDDPSNITACFALELIHAKPQSLRLKSVAPKNILRMSFTFDTSHFERSPLNDDAPRNIPRILLTRETSHFERSLSNNFAFANTPLMSVTRDTSQVPIGPCGCFKHLPFGDSLRHASTALLSCTLDRGENAGVAVGGQRGQSAKKLESLEKPQ